MDSNYKPAKLTKDGLSALADIPDIYKKAIEDAIYQYSEPQDPSDSIWPDYFRAAEVDVLLNCAISNDDKLEDDHFHERCVWFATGWQARESCKVTQGKMFG